MSCSNKCLDVSIFECDFKLFKSFNVCNRYGLFQVVFMMFFGSFRVVLGGFSLT